MVDGSRRSETARGTTVPTDTEKFTWVTGFTSSLAMAECSSVFLCGAREADARTSGFASPSALAASRFESLVFVDFCSLAGEFLFCSALFDGAAASGLLVAVFELGLLPFLSGADFDSADRLSGDCLFTSAFFAWPGFE